MKILFDASIHFGQFAIDNEERRIRCKNSQICVTPNEDSPHTALYTYFENGWMDSVIWDLERDEQDTYYPFMDVFFSNKNINGLADTLEEMSLATMLATKFPDVTSSGAITCALAITRRVDEIHTLYKALLNPKLVSYMYDTYSVVIKVPDLTEEQDFLPVEGHDLEPLYKKAFETFKNKGVDITNKLHDEFV
jgi:hypothetical protein